MGEVEQKLAIDMRNITKTFGTAVANNKVNLQVKYGEVLSLLGENGSGKTTWIKRKGVPQTGRGENTENL